MEDALMKLINEMVAQRNEVKTELEEKQKSILEKGISNMLRVQDHLMIYNSHIMKLLKDDGRGSFTISKGSYGGCGNYNFFIKIGVNRVSLTFAGHLNSIDVLDFENDGFKKWFLDIGKNSRYGAYGTLVKFVENFNDDFVDFCKEKINEIVYEIIVEYDSETEKIKKELSNKGA